MTNDSNDRPRMDIDILGEQIERLEKSNVRVRRQMVVLAVVAALLVLGIGLGAFLMMKKDGGRPEQDSVAVEAPRAAPHPATCLLSA